MSVKTEMEELAREFEDALVFNKPILPVIIKAHEQNTSIHIEPHNPHLVRFRLTRQVLGDLFQIDVFVDPEVVMETYFYHKEAPKGKVVKGSVGADFSDGGFTVIAPGAFKGKTEVPLRWGIGGEVIGSAVVDPDGSVTAVIFPEAKDAD